MKIILVMGLPGAGKTTLADEMAPLLNAKRLNADEVRKAANDWDFSEEGRVRQAKRMAILLACLTLPSSEKSQSFAAFLTSSAFNLLAFNRGAISSAKVVLPAPGNPITKIIFIKCLLTDDGTLIQVHFHQLGIVAQA